MYADNMWTEFLALGAMQSMQAVPLRPENDIITDGAQVTSLI
jgi:hypothetical protein